MGGTPGAGRPAVLPRAFYWRDPRLVAPDLLNKVLVAGDRSGRIVEVEAYCGDIDPAAHTYRRRTPRNEVMFGPPGRLYVYFTYGMHWCCNAVCGETDEGVAVLIRALEPLTGLDAMRAARPGFRSDRELCRGPARLCQALGITGAHNGVDLVDMVDVDAGVDRRAVDAGVDRGDAGGGVTIVDDGVPPPDDPVVTTRVGVSRGAAQRWRWYVRHHRFVSRP